MQIQTESWVDAPDDVGFSVILPLKHNGTHSHISVSLLCLLYDLSTLRINIVSGITKRPLSRQLS